MPPADPVTACHFVLQLASDALALTQFLPDSEFLPAIAQDGIYLRVTLKALGQAVHLAFDLAARLVVLPAAKLPALPL
jgi:hypothetical protein